MVKEIINTNAPSYTNSIPWESPRFSKQYKEDLIEYIEFFIRIRLIWLPLKLRISN